MAYTIAPIKNPLMLSRCVIGMEEELTTGLKHAYFGNMGNGWSIEKGPTDAIYTADLVIDNVISGSRYRVTVDSSGVQMATGTASGTTVTITDMPVYTANMLVKIVIRNASGSTKYKPFITYATMYTTGGSAYIIQQVD